MPATSMRAVNRNEGPWRHRPLVMRGGPVMTRTVLSALMLALLVLGLGACAGWGPPVRVGSPHGPSRRAGGPGEAAGSRGARALPEVVARALHARRAP